MICGMTYYQICWYFLIYSFGGWALEVVYHAVACGKVINRGFLNGPVCPVYGFGVLSEFAMMNTFQGSGYQLSDSMIFLFGVILATAVELIAGWLLDVCFHARWWDYSNKPLNFHGYICLEFSLIWGVTILLVVKVFQSFVEHHTSAHAPSIVLDGRCHTLCIESGGSYSDRCGYSGTEQETYEAGYNSCQHAGDQ